MIDQHTSYERYQRQVILKEFGETGQKKLLRSKILVIGAGGLGCPALQYLAAAGVGTIGIVDDDVVSITNLHRQVLYSTLDIGFPKAEKAKHILTRLNPDIQLHAYNERLTVQNALAIIENYDLVIDGSDNFPTRYLVNDACVLLKKPLVYGAVSRFEGQVAIFNYPGTNGVVPVNYRDLFPEPPGEGEVQNCAEAGVLGVLPGIIGTMQANETIKLITGMGRPLVNSLLTYNALTNHVYEMSLSAGKGTFSVMPKTRAEFENTNYDWLCSPGLQQFEITMEQFNHLLGRQGVEIIDVRGPGELPDVHEFVHRQIPLVQLKTEIPLMEGETLITFCQSGKRSLQAAQWLFDTFGASKKIYSLQGGILRWKKPTT